MKFPKLQRNHWILLCLLIFLTGEVAHYIWAHWGLVTVHSKGQSLSQVIRSIEKQGHVTIKTNMDLTKPVVMHVDEVSLAEAMETLSVVTEGRWRLAYFVGPDKSAVNVGLATFAAGQRNEGWQAFFVPMPPIGEEPAVLPDPRNDSWVVKQAKEPTLQGYLREAAKNVSASFLVPDGFNPPINSMPTSGAISSALPKLVSTAKGKYQEVFLLQGSNRQADRGDGERRDRGDDGDPRFAGNFGGDGRGRGGFDRDAFDERIQNEINKLPPAERTAAQKERDDRKQLFDSLKNLSPEDRAKLLQQMMSDPSMQDKMDNASAARDSRRSPEQKAARAAGYLQRLSAVRGAQ